MNDFRQISSEARNRLVAELHRTVANVSAAVDEAAESVLEAAEADARREADLAAAKVKRLAEEGLEPLRKLSTELLKQATELDREIGRLAVLADEAAEALRPRLAAAERRPLRAVPEPELDTDPELESDLEPELEAEPEPGPDIAPDSFELPPILPTLAPQSPLDRLEAHRRAIAEHPLDFRPRKRFRDPAARPVEIRPGVRLMIEQLRIAGETDRSIAEQLEEMGVEDAEAVLAQVESPA